MLASLVQWRNDDLGTSIVAWSAVIVGAVLLSRFVRRNNRPEHSPAAEPPHGPRHSSSTVQDLTCYRCGSTLRIRSPEIDTTYRCSKCRAKFRLTKTGSPPVFIVLPDFSDFASDGSGASRRQQRDLPDDVRSALSVFSLETTVTFDQIRLAYREIVKAYHPDRVAHLGPELRRLAESKTKEINSAYQVLETFYET
jgi:hypothetical protein